MCQDEGTGARSVWRELNGLKAFACCWPVLFVQFEDAPLACHERDLARDG